MMERSLKKIFAASSGAVLSAAPASALAAGTAGALALGPVTFGAPMALLGLASLPVLWWMMRTTPKKPKEVYFPAMHILFNLATSDQKPVRMPLWHKILRMAVAASLITGLAQPELEPDGPVRGAGPVMMVVDNGWAAARNWQARMQSMNALIDRAGREGRGVIIMPTAMPADGSPLRGEAVTADNARKLVQEMKPLPWPSDHKAALEAVKNMSLPGPVSAVWLSDGLDEGGAGGLAAHLQKMGSLQILEDKPEAAARLLSPPESGGELLTVTVRRANGASEDRMTLSARDDSGKIIKTVDVQFEPGETTASAAFDLPVDIRNKIARVSIDGEQSSGAVLILDERWRRRPVGLIRSGTLAAEQPLLSESGFIQQALGPYADLRHAGIDALVQDQLAVMIMTDSAMIGNDARAKIGDWIESGGTLLRFAGPVLAEKEQEKDDLLPVGIRRGERVLGGALSGGGIGSIAPFEKTSPFYGIKVPDDVVIERHAMAQPGFDLDERVWARLTDGTPLVTAAQRGKGWIVLVHTTANTDWSNVALTGVFIDMMRAVIIHSQGVAGAANGKPLPPLKLLDGYGRFTMPSPPAEALGRDAVIGPRNPPGLYGDETVRKAHNIGPNVTSLDPLPAMPQGVLRKTYQDASYGTDLSGPLLAGALSLLLADLLANLAQRGQFIRRKKPEKPGPAVAR